MADLNVERFGKKGVGLSKFGGGFKTSRYFLKA